MKESELISILEKGNFDPIYKYLSDNERSDDYYTIKGNLVDTICSYKAWSEPEVGVAAVLFALDLVISSGDAETMTLFRIRALMIQPENEDLLLRYIDAVFEIDYRYMDLTLKEVAQSVDDPIFKKRLAALEGICEFQVLKSYISPRYPLGYTNRVSESSPMRKTSASTWPNGNQLDYG